MLQIIQNMTFSQDLELELSMLRRTTITSASLGLGTGPKFFEIIVQPLQLYFSGSWGLNTYLNFGPIPKSRDADLI